MSESVNVSFPGVRIAFETILEQHRDFRRWGLKPPSVLKEALDQSYRKEQFELQRQKIAVEARDASIRLGCVFSSTTPSDRLVEVFVRAIYDRPGFLPNDGDRVVDVGAGFGDAAVWWAKRFNAQVIAFEPMSKPFQELQINLGLNGLDSRSETYNVSLGDGSEERMGTHNSMGVRELGGNAKVVRTQRLDEFNLDPINLLKIDAEGFEYAILQGGLSSIRRNLPRIILETHSQTLRHLCSKTLQGLGYRVRYKGRLGKGPGWMNEVVNLFWEPV